MYCTNCGAEIDDDSVFCSNCGQPIENRQSTDNQHEEEHEDTKDNRDNETANNGSFIDKIKNDDFLKQPGKKIDTETIKDTLSTGGAWAVEGALSLNKQLSQKMEDKKKIYSAQLDGEAQKQKEEQKRQKEKLIANSTKYMSATNLWSWLKESANRQVFYSQDEELISSEKYIEKLGKKLEENEVPVSIIEKQITWDESNYKKTDCFIVPHTEVINPLSFLFQFNHVGRFTFVEEKTFITPPDLPEKPNSPMVVDPKLEKTIRACAIYGLLLAVVGIILIGLDSFSSIYLLILAAGIGLLVFAGIKSRKILAIEEYNKKCAEQLRLYNQAWDNWYQAVFLHNFQEGINGELSRIYGSVYECIKQINEELFPRVVKTEAETSSMNELEQLIERRKKEYR